MKLPFSKPDWKHKNPLTRIAAIAKLSDDNRQETLQKMWAKETDPTVKAAIVSAFDDLKFLSSIANSSSENKKVTAAAEKRCIKQITGHIEMPLPLEDRINFIQATGLASVHEAAAIQGKEATLRYAAIALTGKPSVLQQVISNDADWENRELAIKQINDLASLEAIGKKIRNKDKRGYQLIQEKLESIKVSSGDPATIQAIQKRLCEAIDKLVATNAPLSALDDIEAQINALGKLPATSIDFDLAERYQRGKSLFQRLHNIGDAPVKINTKKADEPDEEAIAAQELLAKQQATQTKLSSQAESILNKANALLEQNKKLQSHHIDKLEQQWHPLKEQFKKHKMADPGAANVLVSKIGTVISRLHKQLDNKLAEQTHLVNHIAEQLATLEKAANAGNSHDCKIIHADIIDKLKALRALGQHPRTDRLSKQLSKLEPQFRELTDWEHYGNNRERKQLCEQMEKLAELKMSVEEKANAVKALQKQWREIEEKETSGTGRKHASGQHLWKRFRAAGNKAWEPCAEHFGKQAERRQYDQSAISEFVTQLQSSADLGVSNWKQIEKLIALAYKSLSEMRNMPRKETSKLPSQLRNALKPLEETREQYWQQHEFAKRKIVESAQNVIKQLERDEDSAKATNEFKNLQQQWKNIGPAKRAVDNELWKEFRALADQAFGKLNEKRDAEKSQRKASTDAYAEAIKGLEALQNCDNLKTLDIERKKLETAADEQQRQADSRKLDSRLKSALATLDKRHDELQKQKLFDDIDEARQAAQAKLDGANGDIDKAKDGVILIEIIAGVDSPAEDQARRMELQVERLAAKVHGNAASGNQLITSAIAWYKNNLIEKSDWQALDKRIQAAIKK